MLNYEQEQNRSGQKKVKHKEYLPKNIKIDINNFLERINTFDPYLRTPEDITIFISKLCQDYNRINEMIKLYINQTKKLILIQLMKVQESISQELLDYSIPGIKFKSINSLREKIEIKCNNLDSVDKIGFLSEFYELVNSIDSSNELFKQLIMYYRTSKAINTRIVQINDVLYDLEEIFHDSEWYLNYSKKILEAYENEDYESTLKLEEEMELKKI